MHKNIWIIFIHYNKTKLLAFIKKFQPTLISFIISDDILLLLLLGLLLLLLLNQLFLRLLLLQGNSILLRGRKSLFLVRTLHKSILSLVTRRLLFGWLLICHLLLYLLLWGLFLKRKIWHLIRRIGSHYIWLHLWIWIKCLLRKLLLLIL